MRHRYGPRSAARFSRSACRRCRAKSIPGGRFVRHDLDVTGWQSYSSTLLAQAQHLPACGRRNPKAARTRVHVYDADSGRRIYGYCVIKKPEQLRDISFAVKSGQPAPSRIYVRMTDRQTGRVVASDPVSIPPISQVTARYTAAENANIDFAALDQ